MIANLPGRIVATMAAVCVFAVALTATLNVYKYDSSLGELVRSRFTFLLRDMRNTLETGMNLGLPLKGLDNVPELIRAHAARDPEILSIEIFGPDGTVLFGTDASFVGDLVAATWLEAWRRSTDPIWDLRERDAETLGITLQDSLGQVAGAIALRYSRKLEDDVLYRMGGRLAAASLVIVAVATAAVALGGYLILRPIRRELRSMQTATEALLAGAPGRSSGDPAFAAFAATTITAQDALGRAVEDIHRLDREG